MPPGEACLPAPHNVRNAVLYRLLHPDDSTFPIPHPALSKYLNPPAKAVERAAPILEDLKETFEVKAVPPKEKRVKNSKSGNFATEAALDLNEFLGPSQFGSAAPGPSQAANGSSANGGFGMAESQTQERTVGLDDPVNNFNDIIADAGPVRAQQVFLDCTCSFMP